MSAAVTRVATRGSALARWQAEAVAARLAAAIPARRVELVVVETRGDRRLDVPIWAMGGQGVFVKEVQAAVLDGRADLAVHSAKDLPSYPTPGLVLAAVPERGDPRDALVGGRLDQLPPGALVATGSVRRRAQLAWLRPDLTFTELRGSVPTRVGKVPVSGAIVVAAAALSRLQLAGQAAEVLEPEALLPQVGQGALAVECRADDEESLSWLARVDDPVAHAVLDEERAFLARLGSGCDLPVAAYATVAGAVMTLDGLLASPDGRVVLRQRRAAPLADLAGPGSARLGRSVADQLLAAGGSALLAPAEPGPGLVTVYLVGAGPGDPGLLTVRAAQLLAGADVVVHDRLAEPALLELAPAGAERIDVGKSPGGPVDQAGINQILVERGRAGQQVVRLKGGDPFVFGRGGEEALALEAAGVAWEVVPGVTSAVAVPAYAGVPVTHRGLSTSFTVVTGHSRFAVDRETNWEALAAAGGTLVVLMGVAHRGRIAARLVAAGLSPGTPVVATRWGTRPDQESQRTTLGELGQLPLQPPATIVIGPVAGLGLGWFERRPLFGRTVVVTRAREQASALSSAISAAGARSVELPTIVVGPPADGGRALAAAAGRLAAGQYDWVAFTSANAVGPLVSRLHDARQFGATQVAAIGAGTAEALARVGLRADLVPARPVAEGLLEALAALPMASTAPAGAPRLLLPRAAVGRDLLPTGLAGLGWSVEVVEAYRTEAVRPSPAELEAAAGADAICFTSSSTVANYLAAAGTAGVPPVVACIGPVTTATARQAGLTVTVEAREATVEALVAALVATLGPS